MERKRFYSPVAMEDVVKHNLNELAGEASMTTYAVVFEGTIGSGVKDFEVEVGDKTFKAMNGRAVVLIPEIEEREEVEAISYKATAEGYEPIEGKVMPKDVNAVVYLRWAQLPVEMPACCCCNKQ